MTMTCPIRCLARNPVCLLRVYSLYSWKHIHYRVARFDVCVGPQLHSKTERNWIEKYRPRDTVLHSMTSTSMQRPWASCQIRKIAGCACAGNAGNVFPTYRLQRKPQVCDPGMHHGTCVTHVPWCMSESLIRGGGENVPGIPSACATRNFAYLTRGPLNTECVQI